MEGSSGFACSCCGEWHDELPFAYHAPAPAHWRAGMEADEASELASDQCVIHGEHFFVRGLVRVPVRDAGQDFEWGVWVSLSEDSFLRMADDWHREGREAAEPVFGWLSTELPVYEQPTLNLKTMVHTQPVGLRPLVELEPTEHPLAVEQREGIDLARVRAFAERLLHGET